MKKLILASFIFASLNLSAQTQKGNWFFAGDTSLGFASSSAQPETNGNSVGNKTKVSKFSFKPSANYFVKDNLAIGLGVLFESQTEKEGSSKDKESSFAVLPGLTYFFKSETKLVPYVAAGAGLMSLSAGNSDTLKYNGFAFSAIGGLAYFLNNSVSLNLGLSYLNSNLKNKKIAVIK